MRSGRDELEDHTKGREVLLEEVVHEEVVKVRDQREEG